MAVEQEEMTETESTENVETASLELQFVDLFSDPIEGLSYEIRYADGSLIGSGSSGGLGLTQNYENLRPDAEIVISVKRDDDGKFKIIGRDRLSIGHQEITMISPKIKLEAETQKSEGAEGTTHEVQPPVPPKVEELKKVDAPPSPPPSTSTTTYTVQAGDYPGKIATKFGMTSQQFLALNPQIKDVTKMQIGDKVNVSGTATTTAVPNTTVKPMTSTAPKVKPTITVGRDADGLPMALYVKNAKDWLGRVIAIPYNWLTSQNAQAGAKSTQGHPSVNPASQVPAVKSKEQPSDAVLEHLQALIAFAEEQVKYDYSGNGTQAILKKHFAVHSSYKIGSTTFPSGSNDWPAKKPGDSKKICQIYVNIALAMAGYWNGENKTARAKESGKDWLAAGFTNVIGELPTVEITMKNDDIVKQADIIYTCPGDVIVYEQYDDPTKAGHIDIRTYHGFMSDFVWAKARSGFPDQSIYKVTGIYRKYSDTMVIARLQAFLRIIRERETTGHPDPYHALHSDKAGVFLTFKNESKHPEGVAAGAYQILKGTFKTISEQVSFWPKNFSPAAQDRFAIYLMFARPYIPWKHPRRNGLGYVLQGNLEAALNEATLKDEWASLPGGSQSRGFTFDQMKHKFDQYTAEYFKKV